MLSYLVLLALALGSCSARELTTRNGVEDWSKPAEASGLNVQIAVDVSKTHPVAPNLWGIFFEEVSVFVVLI